MYRFPGAKHHRITYSFPFATVPLAGLLIPFPLLPCLSPDCLFLSLCRPATRRIAYSTPFAASPLTGLLDTFPFPPRHSPDCIFRFPCPTRHRIAYCFAAAPGARIFLIPSPFRCVCRRIADSGPFPAAWLAELLIPLTLPPRRMQDYLFVSLSSRATRIIAYFVSLARHVAGLLFPLPFPPRRRPDCLFPSLCCCASRCTVYFVSIPRHAAALLIPFPLSLRRSPEVVVKVKF